MATNGDRCDSERSHLPIGRYIGARVESRGGANDVYSFSRFQTRSHQGMINEHGVEEGEDVLEGCRPPSEDVFRRATLLSMEGANYID